MTWRPDRGQVKAAEAAAHVADESADAAGLLLADAVVALVPDPEEIRRLSRLYLVARAEARYRWSAHSDCLDQFSGGVS